MQTRKTRRDSPLAVGAEVIDWVGQSSPLLCIHIQHMRNEMVAVAIVPNDFVFAAGNPLQHAPLLPTPSSCFAEFDPLVAVVGIDHSDLNHIIRLGRAMFEINLVAQHEAIVRRELQLVVVAEPMKLRAFRDLADRRE